MFKEFLRYISVGVVNTISSYLIIITFQYLLYFSPQVSNLIGYTIGLIVSYILNKRFVFKSRKASYFIFGVKFLWAFIVSYAVNFLSLNLLLKFDIKEYIVQAICMAIYSIIFYIICKFYVFKKLKD